VLAFILEDKQRGKKLFWVGFINQFRERSGQMSKKVFVVSKVSSEKQKDAKWWMLSNEEKRELKQAILRSLPKNQIVTI
jgi:hypothetical protein